MTHSPGYVLIYWSSIIVLAAYLAAFFVYTAVSEKGRRSLALALRSLWLHKLRSGLSVLGILIGTGAVIILMACGEGSMQDALDDIKRQGATNIIVRGIKPADEGMKAGPGFQVPRFGLTNADYASFGTIPSIVRRVPLRVFAMTFRNGDRAMDGRLVGTLPEYAAIHKFELTAGRFLTDEDAAKVANVAVIGADIADKLYPFEDPLGKTIRFESFPSFTDFVIIGIIDPRMPTGGSGGSQAAEAFNNDVYIPLETCTHKFGELIVRIKSGSFSGEQVQLNQITLTVADIDQVRPAGDVVRNLLELHHGKRKDWELVLPLDRLEAAEREKARYLMLMFWIAAISLFVGGIGIMNIMLATVTERTREIGVRRALGAKRRDITLQFLIEAIVQTTLGGLVGVVFGIGIVYVLPFAWEKIAGAKLPAQLHEMSIFLSLDFSVLVGIGFGLYPAYRAAMLDPIEALRHE